MISGYYPIAVLTWQTNEVNKKAIITKEGTSGIAILNGKHVVVRLLGLGNTDALLNFQAGPFPTGQKPYARLEITIGNARQIVNISPPESIVFQDGSESMKIGIDDVGLCGKNPYTMSVEPVFLVLPENYYDYQKAERTRGAPVSALYDLVNQTGTGSFVRARNGEPVPFTTPGGERIILKPEDTFTGALGTEYTEIALFRGSLDNKFGEVRAFRDNRIPIVNEGSGFTLFYLGNAKAATASQVYTARAMITGPTNATIGNVAENGAAITLDSGFLGAPGNELKITLEAAAVLAVQNTNLIVVNATHFQNGKQVETFRRLLIAYDDHFAPPALSTTFELAIDGKPLQILFEANSLALQ